MIRTILVLCILALGAKAAFALQSWGASQAAARIVILQKAGNE